ncbi:hypothetical protein GCM10017687_14310 [Streptomyces echinatus]
MMHGRRHLKEYGDYRWCGGWSCVWRWLKIRGPSKGSSFVTRAGQVVEALARHRDPLPVDQTPTRTAVDLHGRGVQELLRALDGEDVSIDTSALMTDTRV